MLMLSHTDPSCLVCIGPHAHTVREFAAVAAELISDEGQRLDKMM